jgi:hypothetical protein
MVRGECLEAFAFSDKIATKSIAQKLTVPIQGISGSSVSGFARQRKKIKIGLEHQERSPQISLLNADNHE